MKRLKKIYHIGVYFVFIAAILLALKKYNLIDVILRTNFKDLNLLTIIGMIIIGILSSQLKIILKIFKINLGYLSSWTLSSINSLFNYVFPAKTGTVFKGVILKNKYGLKYSNYISLLFISNLIFILSGVIILIVFALYYNHLKVQATFFFAFTIFVGYVLYYLVKKKLIVSSIRTRWVNKISDGIGICIKNRNKMLFIFILNYLVIALSALRLYWCFIWLGGDIEFHQVLYMQLLTSLSFLFTITPANLFVKEGIILGISKVFSVQSEIALASALLDRAASIIAILIAVIITLPRYKEEFKFVDRNNY